MKHWIGLVVTLIIFNKASAQIEIGPEGTFANKWHEGKLVLKNNETYQGLVKFDDVTDDLTGGLSLSNKVKFKENENAKKQKFKKKEIDYFEIINNSGLQFKYTYIKVKVQGLILVKIEEEGSVNLYTEDFNYWSKNPQMYYSGSNVYVKKANEKKLNYLFLANAFKSFKKEAMDYFSDCQELTYRIENEELKRKDYKEIVAIYNNCFN
jgi:hypothetical protein